jgi:hypothetical protein
MSQFVELREHPLKVYNEFKFQVSDNLKPLLKYL